MRLKVNFNCTDSVDLHAETDFLDAKVQIDNGSVKEAGKALDAAYKAGFDDGAKKKAPYVEI